ncbi:DUF6502 family protein [Poseidonocella sp. HB161398]|uniref:DUF6502 family protein n=1 Tax=Poseidonocella sp. HB161398 TaxID=2320855 RepID=UPI001108DE4E|nr:DUF6502 family protein [Poseidonocella sp. HB161398]
MTEQSFRAAIERILRPLVRAMIGRGMSYPQLADLLKPIFIEQALRHFGLEGRRMTDSRVSVLTGLQRRDIRNLREQSEAPAGSERGHGPIPRLVALWQGDARFRDPHGAPRALPRASAEGASFESLVAEIGRDVHARTLLDEMVRLGLAVLEGDSIRLVEDSLVPSRDEAMLLGYYAANLGDHAEASAANLLAAPGPGPFFERAVHYNKLSQASLDALEAMARERQLELLKELNAEALRLQRSDIEAGRAAGRIRIGAFVYRDGVRDKGAQEESGT